MCFCYRGPPRGWGGGGFCRPTVVYRTRYIESCSRPYSNNFYGGNDASWSGQAYSGGSATYSQPGQIFGAYNDNDVYGISTFSGGNTIPGSFESGEFIGFASSSKSSSSESGGRGSGGRGGGSYRVPSYQSSNSNRGSKSGLVSSGSSHVSQSVSSSKSSGSGGSGSGDISNTYSVPRGY